MGIRKKKRRWLRILLVSAGLLLLVGVLVLFSRPFQTRLVQRVLAGLNENLQGVVEVEAVHMLPSGVFYISGVSLCAQGDTLVEVERVRGRIHLFSLLHQSLDFDSLIIEGLSAEVEIDSTGRLILEDVFHKPAAEKLETEPGKPWRAHVMRLEVFSRKLRIRQEEKLLFWTDSLRIASAFDFNPEEILVHRLELDDEAIHLSGRGSWPLVPEGHGAGGLTVRLPTQMLQPLAGLELPQDTMAVVLHYDVRDSLGVRLAMECPQAGVVSLAAKVAWPLEKISGTAKGSFFGFRPDFLAKDMGGHAWLSGNFELQGDGPPLETMNITGHVSLRSSSYDIYEVGKADLQFQWKEGTLSGSGEINSRSGSAKFTLRGADLLSTLPLLECDVSAQELRLQDFSKEIPTDLPRLSTRFSAHLRGFPPFGEEGTVQMALAPTRFRDYAADTAIVHVEWRGKALTLSKLYASYKGTTLEATGQGVLDSTFAIHTEIGMRDMRELASKLPLPDTLVRTLSGALRLSADGSFRLSLAGISDIQGKAQLEGQSVAGGPCSFRSLSVVLDTFQISTLFAEGSIEAQDGAIADHEVDSVMISFRGRPDSLWAKVFGSATQDSLRIRFDGLFCQDSAEGFAVDLNTLEAEALGYRWKLEKPTRIAWDGDGLSLDDFGLFSELGVLRADGMISREKEQDFSLVLLDLHSRALGKFLSLPETRASAQLHVSGTGQSPTGTFEVVAESLQWNENGWMERIVVEGKFQGDSLTASGMVFWMADTLVVFGGTLPMKVSFSDGLELMRDRPVAGHLRILGQPLTRLQPYMPWGVQVGGWAGAELSVSGTLQQPNWHGDFIVEDGSLEDFVHGLYYKEIYLNGKWREDTLLVERAEAKAVGKAQGHGTAVMAFPLPKTMALRVDFDHFQLLNRADLRVRISGDMTVEGPPMELRSQGHLTMDELRYRITSATTKEVEPVDLEAELAKLRGDTAAVFTFPGITMYEKMDIAIRISLPRNSWIHGGGASIELEGDVWLYKPPDESEQVFGQIRVVRGTVSLYTRKLEVQEGTITFDGDPQDPNIDITAIEANLKRSRSVEITLKLRGTKNHPEIELSGKDPDGELSYEDIVSYLTLGRRATAAMELFSSGSAEGQAPPLGSAAVTGVSAGVSHLVSQALRLEVFEYRPGQGIAGLSQGELEVGTYVTGNLFVSVIHSMEEKHTGQKVILEYQLLPWLRFRGTRQSEGQSAFDLLFQREWR
ncbi:MAG: translocation/assembly module TamB domain-containing protein [bacterium]